MEQHQDILSSSHYRENKKLTLERINNFFLNQHISPLPITNYWRKLYSIECSRVLENLQKFPVVIKYFHESESPTEWEVEEAL